MFSVEDNKLFKSVQGYIGNMAEAVNQFKFSARSLTVEEIKCHNKKFFQELQSNNKTSMLMLDAKFNLISTRRILEQLEAEIC